MGWGVAGVLLIVVGILGSIAFHEFGHFYFARRFGASVPVFAVGMGPRLFAWRRGATEYSVRAFPIGGFVRILGMLPPNPRARASGWVAELRSASAAEVPEGATAFWELAWYKRVVVLAAGPLANLLLWVLIGFGVLGVIGLPAPSLTLASVGECPVSVSGCVAGPAGVAGVRSGDTIVRVGGVSVGSWDAFTSVMGGLAPGDRVDVEVRRGSELLDVPVTLGSSPVDTSRAFLGVAPEVVLTPLPAADVPSVLLSEVSGAVRALVSFPSGVAELASDTFSSERSRDLDSPVGMVGVGRLGADIGGSEQPVVYRLVVLLGLIGSLNLFLFLFNMLPVLPLDGGHIVGAVSDGVRGAYRRWRHLPAALPFDTARLMPVSYAFFGVLVAVSLLVAYADVVNPLRL